jgi:peptidylprolyl isomerase
VANAFDQEVGYVFRRLRRPAAALSAVLLLPALGACGGDSGKGDDPGSASSPAASESTSDAGETGDLEEVSFSGEVGTSLSAEWHSAVEAPESTTVTTLVEGTGDAVADGDTVSTYLYVGNGSTQEDVYSDYDNGAPSAIPNDGRVGEVFDQLLSGSTYGSRVVAVTTPHELFGETAGDNPLGVDAGATLVVVADLVEKEAIAPTPTDDQAHDASPDTQPSVVEEDGKPTGLDFSGIDEPALDTPVQRVVLEEGTGAPVKASDAVTVNYLGATYRAEEAFDDSYSGQPLTSSLSGLIQGWSIGLTGVKVGSRVLLQIPPAFGYGAQGSGESIPGNATLWFLIDVVAVE